MAPEKYAVVLLVKDEAHDIAAWLAWYQVLGFHACIVYDDDSTDGTWEILQKAAAVQDIRLARALGSRDAPHQSRQDESYRDALGRYGDEFSWMAFFDADEYLSLLQDADIAAFLARFPDADQLCINWCNYGSSGHYLKPAPLPVEAYTWHGGPQERVNRHVKSIVRPKRVGPRWVCVHCFDIPDDKTRLANGQPVSWSATRGIIDTDPDWSAAKLMHYQCRSMEHFIERLKKQPQFQNHRGLWEAYDVNHLEDIRPLRLAARVQKQADAIARGTRLAPQPDLIFDIGMSEGNDTAFYLAKGFRVVGVEPDVEMFYALRERFAAEIASGQLILHNLAAGARHGDIVEFFHHPKHQGLSGLSHARAEFASGYSSYHVLTIDWPALTEKHGVPHYAKIDIEGQEAALLASAAGAALLPSFISVECHSLAPVEALHALGYRRFKLIDQNPPGGLRLPTVQQEGKSIAWPQFSHASGPFGRDLPGEWVDFARFRIQWEDAQPEYSRTWFDCHAWMP
jgi:FkbM family methyltransferase